MQVKIIVNTLVLVTEFHYYVIARAFLDFEQKAVIG